MNDVLKFEVIKMCEAAFCFGSSWFEEPQRETRRLVVVDGRGELIDHVTMCALAIVK